MAAELYINAFIGGLILGGINSWYWYRKGYRGGKLFFLGTIAFFGVIMLILRLF
ncbi:hypothetical protein [Brumimicrobium aurantiacum]|uniref:hypothetical protein n=1 Tax=Brumimicrobium aurantiacum TaxID=1737063 RepID=UPI0014035949|nr:hypothetical protein [Brumimicrobium aurantiacum]